MHIRDGRGRVNHHVAAGVVFGEGDEVADAVGAAEEAAEAVEAEGEAAVGWRAVLEGIEQEAELGLGFFGGSDSIRDFIAFPKNNSGRDVMIDSPSPISDVQLKELSIKTDVVAK